MKQNNRGAWNRQLYPIRTRASDAAIIVKGVLVMIAGFTILFYGPSWLDYLAKHPPQLSAPRSTPTTFIIVLMNDEQLRGELAKPRSSATSNAMLTQAREHRIVIGVKGTDEFDGEYVTNYEVGEFEKEVAREFIADGRWTHYAPWDATAANRHLVVISVTGVDNEFDGYFARDQKLSDDEKNLARIIIGLVKENEGSDEKE